MGTNTRVCSRWGNKLDSAKNGICVLRQVCQLNSDLITEAWFLNQYLPFARLKVELQRAREPEQATAGKAHEHVG